MLASCMQNMQTSPLSCLCDPYFLFLLLDKYLLKARLGAKNWEHKNNQKAISFLSVRHLCRYTEKKADKNHIIMEAKINDDR